MQDEFVKNFIPLCYFRSHYIRRKWISILLMAMFIVAVFYNGRQVFVR